MTPLDKLYTALEDVQLLKYRMGAEGLHYCFKHYSDWSEIEDSDFHVLRLKYLQAAAELEKHIDCKIDNIADEIYRLENLDL